MVQLSTLLPDGACGPCRTEAPMVVFLLPTEEDTREPLRAPHRTNQVLVTVKSKGKSLNPSDLVRGGTN